MADDPNPMTGRTRRPPPLPPEMIVALMDECNDPEEREGWRDFLEGRWLTSEEMLAELDRLVEEVTADPCPAIIVNALP